MADEDDAVVDDEEEEGGASGGGGEGARGEVIVWKQQQQQRGHSRSSQRVQEVSEQLIGGDLHAKIQAAREIRTAVRRSASSSSSPSSSLKTRSRFAAAGVVQPLVLMLFSPNDEAREASLLALLNLAVRNERNKIKIVADGAVPPLVELLKIHHGSLRELATAAILTLSTATPNKPTILASGAAPLLVQILSSGSVQGRVDAVTALHNLFTCKESASACLDAAAVPALINLLKECRKHSKFAEKVSALLEILSKSDEGRTAIASSNGGILALVETVEDGSPISMEHAVGALLTLCQSCRRKYRPLILNEGAIPGLLKLTVEGTTEAQERSRTLLDLLRESPQDKRLASSVLEKIVYDIATRVDGADKAPETAKKLLQDMVQRSIDIKTSRILPKGVSCSTEASSVRCSELGQHTSVSKS